MLHNNSWILTKPPNKCYNARAISYENKLKFQDGHLVGPRLGGEDDLLPDSNVQAGAEVGSSLIQRRSSWGGGGGGIS
jgi:hypothetical protein